VSRTRGSVRPRPRPRKRFGQHFLEPAWVIKLIGAAAPDPVDTYIEIGPGRGALTRALAPLVARLVCIEIDRDLAAALPASLPPHVQVLQGDILDVNLPALLRGLDEPAAPPVRVIGNLPYNISSPILFRLLAQADEGRMIRDATLMLQAEVADRLTAIPGTRSYGTLAVQVARGATVERLLTLPPGAFRPPPKVSSAVVRLRFRPSPADVGDPVVFERLVRGVFLQRRKTLRNALGPVAASFGRDAAEWLAAADIDPGGRPENLTLGDFARLSKAVL
jgi:16S rRNA (adenine1518-N6/adenine1519-N6)-dimethyltransferase